MQGVYAGGECDPSLAGAVTQVSEYSLAQSSHLTFLSFMTDSSGMGLQITFRGKTHPYLYTLRGKRQPHIFELEGRETLADSDMPAVVIL